MKAKITEINTMCPPIQDEFTDCPPYSRRLLDAMAAESIGKHKVPEHWVWSYDPILVKDVVLIESGPCTLQL